MKTAISVILVLSSIAYIGPTTESWLATILSVYAVGSTCELVFDLSGRQKRLKQLEEANLILKRKLKELSTDIDSPNN